MTPNKLVFLGVLGLKKTISSYSFDRIVLIFGYIVECTDTKILSSHFFAISILNPNYDVIKMLVHGQVTIIFVVSVGLSVCLFVCLYRVFLSRL